MAALLACCELCPLVLWVHFAHRKKSLCLCLPAQIRIELFERKQTKFISAHHNALACMALSLVSDQVPALPGLSHIFLGIYKQLFGIFLLFVHP